MSTYSIMVASSAIESHLDPPSVGDRVSWFLQLLEPDPVFAPVEICCVIKGAVTQVDDPGTGWKGSLIRKGPLTVAVESTLPEGNTKIRGLIFEESYGAIPQAVPPTAGVVKRIQVVQMQYAPESDDGSALVPVPGTMRLREVTTSPKAFETIEQDDGQLTVETGILVDLELG